MNEANEQARLVARKIIKRLSADIGDRRGLGDEWEQIDSKVMEEELVPAWTKIIAEEVAKASGQQPEAVQNAGTIAGSFRRVVKSPGGFQLDALEMEKSIKLLNVCGQDEDAASLVVLGESIRTAKGCVLVLKGRDETHWLRDMLIRHKLLTQAKEITKDF